MNIAPIQMVELTFRKFSVEVDFEHLPDPTETRDSHALLENVAIRTKVGFQKIDLDDLRGTPYFVTLRVQVDNQPTEGNQSQRFSPYLIDIEAGAMVALAIGAGQSEDADDLVAVNGPALIWGGVREQLANLTARMPAGAVLLPSVNFHDLKGRARHNRNQEGHQRDTITPADKAPVERPRSPKS